MEKIYITEEGKKVLMRLGGSYSLVKQVLFVADKFPGGYAREAFRVPGDDGFQADLFPLALEYAIEEGLVEER